MDPRICPNADLLKCYQLHSIGSRLAFVPAMSLSICTECLARLQITQKAQTIPIRAFSTTTPQAGASPGRKIKAVKATYRSSLTHHRNRKPRVLPKLPMIGERKALRKRIVISNTNALEVRAFKPTQNWNLFRKPSTLMRRESVELGRTVLDVSAGQVEGRPRTVRRIIAGERGTGKSLMLLQAMSMAFLNDWVVINVPEGRLYTPMVVLKLIFGRPGVYDCSFCLCSYAYLFRKAAVTGRSRPHTIKGIPGITGDDIQPAKTDR